MAVFWHAIGAHQRECARRDDGSASDDDLSGLIIVNTDMHNASQRHRTQQSISSMYAQRHVMLLER